MTISNPTGDNPAVTVTSSTGVRVGYDDVGTLAISGGTLQVLNGPMVLGDCGQGTVNQTGGLVTCAELTFGGSSDGNARYTYNLSSGTLVLPSLTLGNYGTYAQSAFNFGGGTLRASGGFATAQPMTLTGNGGNATLDTAGFAVTLSGKLSGSGGLDKQGLNTLALSAANTYTGPTTVAGGALQVDGSLASSSAVTVQDGGTLSGIGSVGSVTVSAGGQIAPGDAPGSIGTLTFNGNLTLNSGAVLDFDLASPSRSDMISMLSETLTLSGQQFADFNFSPEDGFGEGTYTLINATSIQGSLGSNLTGTIGGRTAWLSTSGGNLVLTVVPEPSTLILVGIATIGLIGFASRRMKRAIVASAVLVSLSLVAGDAWGAARYAVIDLGTLGGDDSYACSINSSGEVAGYSWTVSGYPGTPHAFLYQNGRMTDLGTLGGSTSSAYGINDSGQVVGMASTRAGGDAFLYSSGTMSDLGTLGAPNMPYSCAFGINNIGQVVGHTWVNNGAGDHAFLYSDGVMTDLGTLGAWSGAELRNCHQRQRANSRLLRH